MDANFKVKRGTNISHWLSQSDARGDERRSRFTQADARLLADTGLDHLRLPIDEVQMWDDQGQPIEEAWDLLQTGLDWVLDNGMNAIVDLHILRSHFFNAKVNPLFSDPAAAERFADCWRTISARLVGRPLNRVAYELMNEPVADDPQDWNRVARVAYDAIRVLEKDRCIVLGSNKWNGAWHFNTLDVPENDRNMILTFHYYNPMALTHYRAPWVPDMTGYTGPVQYPGQPIAQADFNALPHEVQLRVSGLNLFSNAGTMTADLMWPLAVSARTGLPLYCGEFGVVSNVPDGPRIAWYRDFKAVLEQHDIAWANWDFRGGFALFTKDGRKTAACSGLFG